MIERDGWKSKLIAEDGDDKSYHVTPPPCSCCGNVAVELWYADSEEDALSKSMARKQSREAAKPKSKDIMNE